MFTVYPRPSVSDWPPCAKKIYRQGRPGKNPRKVVFVRIKPLHKQYKWAA